MEKYKVTILPIEKEIFVKEGTSLLEAQRIAGLHPDAPCGGNGTCGKCTVEIISGRDSTVEKACSTLVDRDIVIKVNPQKDTHHLLTEGIRNEIDVQCAIKSLWIKVERPRVGDCQAEWVRIKKSISNSMTATYGYSYEDYSIDISLLSNIYDDLTGNNYLINVILYNNEVIAVSNKDFKKYVMAFDIGTTSIVGYLLNADTGEQAVTVSMLNPQTQYGGDVINRSNYAIENGVGYLTSVVRTGLNELIREAAAKAHVKKSEIYLISVVGNTCMHHLFLGISPKPLVHAPYNPVISEKLEFKASDLELNINPRGKILVLPNIAGFVGADTAGVLLATDFDILEPLTLAIDIGTNGELVMGNKERMIACSTAAGPAFEGAKIKFGMRGKEGAIEHMVFEGDRLKISVIGGVSPIGICGSGLMDVVATLVENEIIDESGKLADPDTVTSNVAKANKDRLKVIDGEKVFIIHYGGKESEHVYITQRDIREVQLAKAAMAAGMELMAAELGIELHDIKQVLIAGAFGNYMTPHSACAIGLIPAVLEERIVPVGNAAGEGAKVAALNYKEFLRSEEITNKVEFLELAANPGFQDCFVDQLSF